MWTESSLERAHVRPLEWGLAVLYYLTQPLQLRWIRDGVIRRWTPDILVDTGPKTLVEVKPFAKTQSEEFWQWAAEARNAAQAKGYEFQVWTERDLPPEPCRSNIDLLLRYRNELVPTSVEEKVTRLLREEGPLPIGVILERLGEERGLPLLYCLMTRHSVSYDIDQPMGPALALRSRYH